MEPNFFVDVERQWKEDGPDAFFTITRRQMQLEDLSPPERRELDEQPPTQRNASALVEALSAHAGGTSHGGHDCFVFARTALPSLHFGKVFVGPVPPHGTVIYRELAAAGLRPHRLDSTKARLTMHLSLQRQNDFDNRRLEDGLPSGDVLDWLHNVMFANLATQGMNFSDDYLNTFLQRSGAGNPCASGIPPEDPVLCQGCLLMARRGSSLSSVRDVAACA
eukprot:TRINITY_DN38616_c0_g1_i5.p1 TRINITY_DN38616_c0_g1~~TRINITY_DN38616_c0_g1_i5.p1  ORF type:complete len:221 (+),score=51.97 TRINITY_DN38616_c0_g1_i5:499-1161(+)